MGSSGAALDCEAHPVLGAQFSRLAAWRRMQCSRKGFRSALRNRRATNAPKESSLKSLGVRISTITIVAGESHDKSHRQRIGEGELRDCGSGFRQNNPQFGSRNEGGSRADRGTAKTGNRRSTTCDIKRSKSRLKVNRQLKGYLSRNRDRRRKVVACRPSMRREILERIR